LGDPLKGNLLLLYKPLHLEAQHCLQEQTCAETSAASQVVSSVALLWPSDLGHDGSCRGRSSQGQCDAGRNHRSGRRAETRQDAVAPCSRKIWWRPGESRSDTQQEEASVTGCVTAGDGAGRSAARARSLDFPIVGKRIDRCHRWLNQGGSSGLQGSRAVEGFTVGWDSEVLSFIMENTYYQAPDRARVLVIGMPFD
jgi:hypothetical protein